MAIADPAQSIAATSRRVATGSGVSRPAARVAARVMMWNLEATGWTAREAGNLVGLAHGLRPALSGWNEREIEHLRFLRALVDAGRLGD